MQTPPRRRSRRPSAGASSGARRAGRGFAGLLALAFGLMTPVAGASTESVPVPRTWQFQVSLDDRPIGRHRFDLAAQGSDGWRLTSQAEYEVRLLGVVVYRYRHQAQERWRDGCLSTLSARTDDNGKLSELNAERVGDAWRIARLPPPAPAEAPGDVAGCLMSFAYWNPALKRQSRLINPQNGRIEAVNGAAGPSTTFTVEGRAVEAQAWRLTTASGPIDVWYASDGQWMGLDATLSNGRRLRYRLSP